MGHTKGTDSTNTGHRRGLSRRAGIGIGIGALLVRVLYLASVSGTPVTDLLLIDSATYDRFARLILDGRFSGESVYSMNVLYPYVLAFLYRIAGDSPWTVFAFQAVLDAASVVAIAAVAVRTFGRGAGIATGVLGALYGPLVFYTGTLLTPTLIVGALAFAMLFVTRHRDDGRTRWLLLAGASIGVATLARGNNALIVLALLPVFRAWTHGWRPALTRCLLVGIGPAVMVGAVTARNALVEGRFVPIAANYAAFYVGHNPSATGLYVLPAFTRGAAFEDEVQGTRAALSAREGRPLTVAESAAVLFRDGLAFARTHPREELRLAIRKLFFFWNRTRSPTNLNYHFARDHSAVLRALPLNLGLLLPLAFLGIVVTWGERRALLHVYAFGLVPLVTCLAFFVSAEYRLPVVSALFPFAGAFLARVPALLRRRPGAGPLLVGLTATLAVAVLANWQTPLLEAQTRKRVDYLNAGTLYGQEGRFEEARAMFRRAAAIDPAFGPAYAAWAEVEHALGNDAEALRLQALAAANPVGGQFRDVGDTRAPHPRLEEAAARYEAGDYDGAEALFRSLADAFRDAGDAGEARRMANNVGLCQYKRGAYEAARATFEAITAADSTYVFAYTNLARVYLALNDSAAASRCVARAAALAPANPRASRSIERLRDALQSEEVRQAGSERPPD